MDRKPLFVARLPIWYRYVVVIFGVVWFVFIGVFLVLAIGSGARAAVPIALIMAAYAGFILWRSFHLGLVAYPDEIVLRNPFKTRRIPKRSVDGFRIGSSGMPLPVGRTIVVLVSDDTAVSADGLMWTGMGRRGTARLEQLLAQLRDWQGTP